MSRRFAPIARAAAVLATAVAAFGSTAGAQVSASFYSTIPSSPDPLSAYPGTAFCTATTVGTASGGFSLNFGDAGTRTALCPGQESMITNGGNPGFGARFTGSLFVASAGLYDVYLDADDGNALAVNGAVVRTDWYDKGGGPGWIQFMLNAGANPFVFDYYQGPCCGAYVNLTPGRGVTIDPPVNPGTPTVAPEPSSLVLTGMGILAVGFGARRRRRVS